MFLFLGNNGREFFFGIVYLFEEVWFLGDLFFAFVFCFMLALWMIRELEI